jgi:small subunit ribosomal protein S16
MLKIKLKKIGRVKNPFYRIVVAETLNKRDGKIIYDLGYYDPFNKKLKIDHLTLYKYIKYGVYPTNSIRHLIYKIL